MSSALLEALPATRDSRTRVATPHVLFVGGVDHELRIPFMLNLRNRGFQVSAAGTAEAAPFSRAGIRYYPFRFERFLNPLADWTALRTLSKLFADVRPDLVQSFDTKPNLLVPFAASKCSWRAGSPHHKRTCLALFFTFANGVGAASD